MENSSADLLRFPPWAGDPGRRHPSTPFHHKRFSHSPAQENDLPFRIVRRNARRLRRVGHLWNDPLSPEKRSLRIALGLAALVVVLVSPLAWLGGKELTSRVGGISQEARGEISGGMRLSIYKDGIRIFGHRPFLGAWNFSRRLPSIQGLLHKFLCETEVPPFAVPIAM